MNSYFHFNNLFTDFTISSESCGITYDSDDYGGKRGSLPFLLKEYEREIEYFKTRTGKDRSFSTLKKHESVLKHLEDFGIRYRGKKDISFSELDENFISDFCNYLMDECKLSRSTAWVYHIPLKRLTAVAFSRGIIKNNPFALFHLAPDVKARSFLTESELQQMMNVSLKGKVPNLARDLFVFSCWTGLSYVDIKNLTREQLVEHKGDLWIVSKRQKTNKPFQIKLLEPAREILTKYEKKRRRCKDPHIFKTGCYDYLNDKLKDVVRACGIDKKISFHCARHTFATMALNNGMSLESVSQILGHSSIKTTQLYARITISKLENDFSVFHENIKDAFF